MIAAILLAAGSSRRFGVDNKLLAEVHGLPLVAHVARVLARCRIDALVAVTGPDHDAVSAAVRSAVGGAGAGLATPDIAFVFNPRHAEGIGTSVAAGIAALPQDVNGALVVQGDMPALAAVLIDALIARFEATGRDRLVFPVTPERDQMNPVLWPRRSFPALARLTGDRGAKSLIVAEGEHAETVMWADARAFTDLDTREALVRFVPGRD
ncbi:MAG: nucleotidyltransferase family protein [Hyphomicrobiaceae bacterium]